MKDNKRGSARQRKRTRERTRMERTIRRRAKGITRQCSMGESVRVENKSKNENKEKVIKAMKAIR